MFDVIKYPQKVGITNEQSLTEISKILYWIQTYSEKTKQLKPSNILLEWLRESEYLNYLNQL